MLEGRFKAEMLMTLFSVQVLFPKQNTSQIDKMMIALKEHSEWISNNKTFHGETNFNTTIRRTYKKPGVLQTQAYDFFHTKDS
jgi:hypothetical protein